nr:NAD-dependent epimerase/dehydratase family protein [uncultured Actinoplanes sp.]
MRVLVTGGAGFIGTHVCRELLERGHNVRVLDDFSTGHRANLAGLRVQVVDGSVTDTRAVAAAVAGMDSVVHLAAVSSVPGSFARPYSTLEINTFGTGNVLAAATGVGAHVVVASSAAVYGDGPARQRTETARPDPRSPYAVSKLAAELYATAWQQAHAARVLTFRLFNVFGPLQPADSGAVVPGFLAAVCAGVPLRILGDGTQVRDFVPVTMVAEVVAVAVERRLAHLTPVNLAAGRTTDLLQLIAHLEDILGRRLPREHSAVRAGDIHSSCADTTVLRQLFPHVTAPPLGTALRKTLAWWQAGEGVIPAATSVRPENMNTNASGFANAVDRLPDRLPVLPLKSNGPATLVPVRPPTV